VLLSGAGILAAAAGWMIGEQFFQSASASLTKDERTLNERYPISNTMMKQDRVIATPVPAQTEQPAVPNDMLETARAWLNAPVTLPRRQASRSEKPSRLFLNDSQIAGIKKRLNLTPAQRNTGSRWKTRCVRSRCRSKTIRSG
jgi:hypothetical protein